MDGLSDRHIHAEAESEAWDDAHREAPHLELAEKIGVDINPNFDGLPFAPFTATQLRDFYDQAVETGRAMETPNVKVRG